MIINTILLLIIINLCGRGIDSWNQYSVIILPADGLAPMPSPGMVRAKQFDNPGSEVRGADMGPIWGR